jgi:hypothetical protein
MLYRITLVHQNEGHSCFDRQFTNLCRTWKEALDWFAKVCETQVSDLTEVKATLWRSVSNPLNKEWAEDRQITVRHPDRRKVRA